jgi:hypothetical protein
VQLRINRDSRYACRSEGSSFCPNLKLTLPPQIHIKHPIVTDAEKYAAMNTLCEMLLISDVPENLRGIYPEMAFTFCPSREGRVDSNDEVFAQYFCKTIVEKLCLGKDELAKKMEATKDSFLSRNSTKFYHQP